MLGIKKVVRFESIFFGDSNKASAFKMCSPSLDFSADPNVVSAVAEAYRLSYAHMFNRAFATEISLIDPLPHQRVAVYDCMIKQSPLRFLLADDAGAGKTIMTGLYIREMLARRLIRRILIVPPAGLVGNWERELRNLFQLRFKIASGAKAGEGNPFQGAESDFVIVSIDTLAGKRMFGHLRTPETEPYDLVVFDEAHKLSATQDSDLNVRKTDRYKLAESIVGSEVDNERWHLPWSARNVLLLTATPHMGKDYPYYFLWRLLEPKLLSTYGAFARYPENIRKNHFIRRTKEEMVRDDGTPIYPQRNCNTLNFKLSQGPNSEQELYDETTSYIRDCYKKSEILNRSAAQLAMSVFQRRLASSTYALMRSFERRKEKLQGLIEDIESGRVSEDQFYTEQGQLEGFDDLFETSTADEDAEESGNGEKNEEFESRALKATTAVNLSELKRELLRIQDLLGKAQKLYDAGKESKFTKLLEVIENPDYADQKLIIFSEHRDTVYFLVQRLEGLGFTGQVAQIHGGMPYHERERQVDLFRKSVDEGGANYLIATDAAGEGINLQFCWLMVNYDIPWNPARLEQRMGRIHRYGQAHDPVIIANLIAGDTREGRVLKTLLDKLEAIRKQLNSDKVFDVVGRLFEGMSIKDYFTKSITVDDSTFDADLDEALSVNHVREFESNEQTIFGKRENTLFSLDRLLSETEKERFQQLLPGYLYGYMEKALSFLGLKIYGDLRHTFGLVPLRPQALVPLLPAIERYPKSARELFTINRPTNCGDEIWLRPGEQVFDAISSTIISRFSNEALRGAVFEDSRAKEPYLFHIVRVSIMRTQAVVTSLDGRIGSADEGSLDSGEETVETTLVGLKQTANGTIHEWPVENLLQLRGFPKFPPSQVPLAAVAHDLIHNVVAFAQNEVSTRKLQSHRDQIEDNLYERLNFTRYAFGYQNAELAAVRRSLSEKASTGDTKAREKLMKVKERQRNLEAKRDLVVNALRTEPEKLKVGEVELLVNALVIPAHGQIDANRTSAEVEEIAMNVAIKHEETFGAVVTDVSNPALSRKAGFADWPGFDLKSERPDGWRAIEVKGRARGGNIEISENEWAKACTMRDRYWLYVVYDCAGPNPSLNRIRDPFGALIFRSKAGVTINENEIREKCLAD